MRVSWSRYIEPLAELGGEPSDDLSAKWVSPTGDTHYEELRTALLDEDGASGPVFRGPIVSTRMGLMGTTLRGLVARNCSMWVALCEADVTERMLSHVGRVRGVEVLRAMSRYRFIVGFSPLHDDETVKTACEAVLGVRRTRLSMVVASATATFELSSIVAGPPTYVGGPATYEVAGAASREELTAKVAAFGELWEEVATV